MEELTFSHADPRSPEAAALMDELSATLKAVTGRSGRASFNPEDVAGKGGCFLVARLQGKAVACGGFRPMGNGVAEIKRVYVRQSGQGIGQKLFHTLTDEARREGYSRVVLETGRCNTRAMDFYHRLGCHEIENYGRYADRPECACFELSLAE